MMICFFFLGQRGTLGTDVGHTGTLGHVSCRSTQGMSINSFLRGVGSKEQVID